MNTVKLIDNFLNEEYEEFRDNLNDIIQQKIIDKKMSSVVDVIGDVFESNKSLNTGSILHESTIDILRDSVKQNSTITIELGDLAEVYLKPKHSEKILEIFDTIDESNQKILIENLISTKVGFEKTINFCTKYKRKAK
jgi:hypothetical protein|tara:strand:- start:2270 stop:2683 length:414 start_codon:yes stop_codon:yes gene_type:complete